MKYKSTILLLAIITYAVACQAEDKDTGAGVYIFQSGAVREILILKKDGTFTGHIAKFDGKRFTQRLGGGSPFDTWKLEGNTIKLTTQGPYAEYYLDGADLIEMKKERPMRPDDPRGYPKTRLT